MKNIEKYRIIKVYSYLTDIEFYLENLAKCHICEFFDDMKKNRAQFTLAMYVNREEISIYRKNFRRSN